MALEDAGFKIVYDCIGGKDNCRRLFRDFDAIDDKNEIFVGENHRFFMAMLEEMGKSNRKGGQYFPEEKK